METMHNPGGDYQHNIEKDKKIELYMPLVRGMAYDIWRQREGYVTYTFEDLISAGVTGLVVAVNHHKQDQTAFINYAKKSIKRYLYDFIGKEEPLGKAYFDDKQLFIKANAISKRYLQKNNRHPTFQEILSILNENRKTPITPEQLERAMDFKRAYFIFLDKERRHSGRTPLHHSSKVEDTFESRDALNIIQEFENRKDIPTYFREISGSVVKKWEDKVPQVYDVLLYAFGIMDNSYKLKPFNEVEAAFSNISKSHMRTFINELKRQLNLV